MYNKRESEKKVLLTTVPVTSIGLVNRVTGQHIDLDSIDDINDCLQLANNESFQSGKIQPAVGIRFLKENIPSADMLEYPQWHEYTDALKNGYDIVAIGFYTTNYYDAIKMAKMAKESGVKEVWAGNFGSLTPGVLDYFDRVFTGYAERELKLAIDGIPLDKIRHPIITTPFRALYHNSENAGIIVSKRGCKFKCNFCSTPIFSPKTDGIHIEEIERVLSIYRDMGIDYIIIQDETFLQDRYHAKKTMNLLKEKHMKWFCASRADLIYGKVTELKDLGFNGVYMGIESMRDSALNDHKKGESVEKVTKVVEELRINDVSVSGTYMLGHLSDTLDSIKEDLEELNRLFLYCIVFLVFTPYPELPIYKVWEESGTIINKNWRDYDGMTLVFNHPHMSPEEVKDAFRYAVTNVCNPYNYNKRRILKKLDILKTNMKK